MSSNTRWRVVGGLAGLGLVAILVATILLDQHGGNKPSPKASQVRGRA